MTKQLRQAESGAMNALTVVDYIVERLAAEGVSHCFGVAGDYLLSPNPKIEAIPEAMVEYFRRDEPRRIGDGWYTRIRHCGLAA
jgi:hypothetical protein